MTAEVDAVALLIECPVCGAKPTFWCVTYRPTVREPGHLTTWLHEPRQRPVRALWLIGWYQGIIEGHARVRNQIDRGESREVIRAEAVRQEEMHNVWLAHDRGPYEVLGLRI